MTNANVTPEVIKPVVAQPKHDAMAPKTVETKIDAVTPAKPDSSPKP